MKTIALFGESEKGPYDTPILCQTLSDLHSLLGQPPPESRGLLYAIQALHYKNQLLYIRVREEGYSTSDYFEGLKILGRLNRMPPLSAVCAPGVGDLQIIGALSEICQLYHSILIMNQRDLYDFLFST
jgi:hypothetical protein